MKASVQVDGVQTILRNLNVAGIKIDENALTAAQAIAALLESWAKTHHLYEDRTGNLTNSTRGFVADVTEDLVTVVLSASMDYAVFLEIGTERLGEKYAWLRPAVQQNETRIKQILRQYCGAK